ncbi:Uncharacterised protein [uncultured archaeon]|nr:Uncharacterised protein [uncultured archaeon]
MTHEEFTIAATQVAQEFWDKHRPSNLLFTENNANELAQGIVNFVRYSGAMPGPKDICAIVKFLGDIENGGKLQFHHPPKAVGEQPPPPPPQNPADNLPFWEVKELKFLRTVEDVQRFKARLERDGTGYLSGFKRLRPESQKDYEELNARLTYIVQNELDASHCETDAPAQPAKPRVTIPTLIAQARAAVDAMTVGDVGQSGSSAGRRQLLQNKKQRLYNEISKLWGEGIPHNVILERTKDAIRDFGSSSIR